LEPSKKKEFFNFNRSTIDKDQVFDSTQYTTLLKESNKRRQKAKECNIPEITKKQADYRNCSGLHESVSRLANADNRTSSS
jgi:hypothetical protein